MEWAEVHGNYYGTPKAPLEKAIQSGEILVLDIDVQGFEQIRKTIPQEHLFSVFIKVPAEQLEQRLILRAQDSSEAIKNRCANALAELGKSGNYQLKFDNRNGQLDSASRTLNQAVRSKFVGH